MARFHIHYMKPDFFSRGVFGEKPDPRHLERTHTHLRDFHIPGSWNDTVLDLVFRGMQAEVWSPNGEARSLIERKELGHTSMSIGDVIEQSTDEGGRMWVVTSRGFEELNP